MGKALPQPPQPQVIASHQQLITQGPIPVSQEFKAYNDTLPGAADRILSMAEAEAGNRHRKDQLQLETESGLSKLESTSKTRGQWFSFLLALGGLGLAAFFGAIGLEGASIAAIVTAVSPIVVTTVAGLLRKP
jgi:uncharacterized membrane protein